MSQKRILIVGGVAGGASCAARARRLDEDAEIIVFERGPFVSFANCGLPYYVGKVIQDEAQLLVSSPELLRSRFNIEVRTENEVTAIDRVRGEIEVRRLASGETYRERYDALVLAPGASPVRPPLPGIELPGIFVLRTIADSRQIRRWIDARSPKTAVIVGAGFIGLEIAENLHRRGLKVTILEMLPQVMPPLDPEMAEFVNVRLIENHVAVQLNQAVASFEQGDKGLAVHTAAGSRYPAEMVVLSMGVRPETALARQAGLALGHRGGVQVDAQMRTSDARIWAVGDVVESPDFITGESGVVPLAGPANRQGRIAADSICGRPSRFRGAQSTAVCGAFGLTIAMTGASEKTLRRCGMADYEKIYLHPDSHAGYYPGANPMHIKLLFSRRDGKVLGAQAIGEAGVEKRMDVIAMAIQMGATVYDLEEAELCYAPQYSSAKDPVNLAGMIAANVLRGDLPLSPWCDLPDTKAFVLDVREPLEFAAGHIDDAVNIPLGQLRARLGELPRDRQVLLCCGVGQRAYYAVRLLRQRGFDACVLSGGMRTYNHLPEDSGEPEAAVASGSRSSR
jgi:NADPH-dependent 2,4-dienoyl-CoA reductase/sulfur reductase-like enzyme/rhodanese-related sulfurtransferase